ncbi:MAG: hypothetical protein V4808_01745 [Pseudomonadota bacterium]
MLSKTIAPKTKAELIRALQSASFRSFEVFESERLAAMPSLVELSRVSACVIVIK